MELFTVRHVELQYGFVALVNGSGAYIEFPDHFRVRDDLPPQNIVQLGYDNGSRGLRSHFLCAASATAIWTNSLSTTFYRSVEMSSQIVSTNGYALQFFQPFRQWGEDDLSCNSVSGTPLAQCKG
jgi:hypothetical protein